VYISLINIALYTERTILSKDLKSCWK